MTATTAGEGEGALSYALHPLVILTVSDHFTRARLASDDAAFNAHFSAATQQQQAAEAAQTKRRWKKPRVLGALLGTQRGREVEICNCFEMLLSTTAEEGGGGEADEGEEEPLKGSVDVAFLRMKAEQFKKVFPDYDVLGWYTDGREPRASDIALHRQLAASGAATESPLLLMLDTAAAYAADTKDLPIRVFESEIHVAPDGQPLLTLSPVVYRIAVRGYSLSLRLCVSFLISTHNHRPLRQSASVSTTWPTLLLALALLNVRYIHFSFPSSPLCF